MSRINNHTIGNVIESPSGIIESLLRDFIHTEHGNSITTKTSDTKFISSTLLSVVNDFYKDSIVTNLDKNESYTISTYNGSTKEFTISSTSSGWLVGHKLVFSNVNCRIDTDSFDVFDNGLIVSGNNTSTVSNTLTDSGASFLTSVKVGMKVYNNTMNTTSYIRSVNSNTQLTLENDIFTGTPHSYKITGVRHGNIYRKSINVTQKSEDILKKICYEFHCVLINSFDKYRIIPLEGGNTVGTLSTPKIYEGTVQIFPRLGDLSEIYTDFVFEYAYNYEMKTYTKKIQVNKDYSSNSNLVPYQGLCKQAEIDYKIKRKYNYKCEWIYDDATAEDFAIKKISHHTYLRMIFDYIGDIKLHALYEEGDKLFINYPSMIPTGINNTVPFMITGLTISPKKKAVKLSLLY